MRVDPKFLKSVAFICEDGPKGRHVPIATCFFVAVRGNPGHSFMYAVTARHVVEDALGDQLYIRGNRKAGKSHDIPTSRLSWQTSKTADVAAIRMEIPTVTREDLDFAMTRLEQFVDADYRYRGEPFNVPFEYSDGAELISENDGMAVGTGDDLFSCGLFVQQPGEETMIPIARFGTIAAMPIEPVSLPRFRNKDSFEALVYLVEYHSWGGQSGAPVFWAIPAIRGGEDGLTHQTYVSAMLGLVSAHFNIPEDVKAGQEFVYFADDTGNDKRKAGVRLNSGIAAVTPASEIRALLEDPVFADERKNLMAQAKSERPKPTMDQAEARDDEGFSKGDFESALRRVSRRLTTSQSAEASSGT